MTASDETNALIARLSAEALPVRPLPAPWRRAGLFLAGAALVVAIVVMAVGLRPDLAMIMAMPGRRLEWLASVATGVLSTFAAFHLAVPGRSALWALLPVPAAVLWLGALGYGMAMDVQVMGMAHGMGWHASWGCFKAITFEAVPMAALMFYLLRFADAARPAATAAFGVLAVASLSAAGLTLYHELETAFTVLIWHVGTIALLVAVAMMGNRAIFRLMNR